MRQKLALVTLSALALLIIMADANLSVAKKDGPPPPARILSEVVPVNDYFRGMSYVDLSAEWWQWAFGQEGGILPGYTPDGYLLAEQPDEVFFLAGSFFPVSETRAITIPYGKPIFFPVINQSYIGFPWLEADTPEFAWTQVTPVMDAVDASKLKCVIDGVEVPDLAAYRVATEGAPDEWSFTIDIPPDNPISPSDRPPDFDGVYPTVSDGYWLLLKPLSTGPHTLHIYAEGQGGFIQDITYNITIAER